jgi:hypothetical protein
MADSDEKIIMNIDLHGIGDHDARLLLVKSGTGRSPVFHVKTKVDSVAIDATSAIAILMMREAQKQS